MKTKLIILSIAALCLSAAPAMAATFGDGGAALQAVLDNATVGGSSNIIVANNVEVPDVMDNIWENTGKGSVSTIIFELGAAFAPWNNFGVYDSLDASNTLQIFAGGHTEGDSRTLFIFGTGDVYLDTYYIDPAQPWLGYRPADATFPNQQYGFYLDSTGLTLGDPAYAFGNMFYSDTGLNPDGEDHMYAYQGVGDTMYIPDPPPLPGDPQTYTEGTIGPSYFILAWEDLDASAGWTDRDYEDMVVLVESVQPIPVPGAVLLGILGLSAAGIKLRRFA